jgi:hypothetical protein
VLSYLSKPTLYPQNKNYCVILFSGTGVLLRASPPNPQHYKFNKGEKMNIEITEEQAKELIAILETASANFEIGATEILGQLKSQHPKFFDDED